MLRHDPNDASPVPWHGSILRCAGVSGLQRPGLPEFRVQDVARVDDGSCCIQPTIVSGATLPNQFLLDCEWLRTKIDRLELLADDGAE